MKAASERRALARRGGMNGCSINTENDVVIDAIPPALLARDEGAPKAVPVEGGKKHHSCHKHRDGSRHGHQEKRGQRLWI